MRAIGRALSSYASSLRLFSRDVRLYLLVPFLFGLTLFGGITAVLLNLYLLRLGYGPEFIGLISSIGSLAMAAGALPAGAIGQRFGCRRAMIGGLGACVVGMAAFPLAGELSTGARPAALIAANGLTWLGVVHYLVNSGPFLMSATGAEERSHAYSVQTALSPLAAVVGSLVGGLLPSAFAGLLGVSADQPAAYRGGLVFAAALLAPAIPALLATRDAPVPRVEEAPAARGPLPLGLILMLSLVVFLQGAGENLIRTFFNVYLDSGLRLPTVQIGALSGVGQALAIPAALATPLLVARWGYHRTYVWASLALALFLLPLALLRNVPGAAIGYMGVISAASLGRPCILVCQYALVPPAWRPTMGGATTLAVGVSSSLLALIAGYLIASSGYAAAFLVGVPITAAGALLFWSRFSDPIGKLALVGQARSAEAE